MTPDQAAGTGRLMKTRQQEQTEGHGREALRLMKELAKSRDPVVRKSCLKAIRESHGDMLDSFRDEVLDAVGEGQMTAEEAGKTLEKLDKPTEPRP